jgi:hypothetical protein
MDIDSLSREIFYPTSKEGEVMCFGGKFIFLLVPPVAINIEQTSTRFSLLESLFHLFRRHSLCVTSRYLVNSRYKPDLTTKEVGI